MNMGLDEWDREGARLAEIDPERAAVMLSSATGMHCPRYLPLAWQASGRRLLRNRDPRFRQILACVRGYVATFQSESNDDLHAFLLSVASGNSQAVP